MALKVIASVVVAVGLFLVYVATREGKFRYERSGVIDAPPERIFPYISDLKLGGDWSPYERMAPEMKKNFVGSASGPGAKMVFESKKAGSGSLEILKVVPNQAVDLRLIMTAPFKGDNLIEYRLMPEGSATRFTWTMSGEGGFMGKLMNVFIDCEKMVADQFSEGIQNLKTLIEKGARP